MNKYINAESLLTKIKAYRPYMYLGEDALSYAIKMVELEPSADVRESVHGEWIDCTEDGYVECPFCHSATNCDGNKEELHFCFSCGAKMEVEK